MFNYFFPDDLYFTTIDKNMSQRFCTKILWGIADFARHSTPSYLYKSAQKASKQSYNTIISTLGHIYFSFYGGVRDFAQKYMGVTDFAQTAPRRRKDALQNSQYQRGCTPSRSDVGYRFLILKGIHNEIYFFFAIFPL